MQIITHDGIFHADEVFAIALLQKVYGEIPIVRTRNIENLSGIFVDIGGSYNPAELKFDHHQVGGAGSRLKKGIPYSSFGLIWKEYGTQFCASATTHANIDAKLVSYIDAVDNGVTLVKGEHIHYLAPVIDLAGIISKLNPPWTNNKEEIQTQQFYIAVTLARTILDAFIAQENALQNIDQFILGCKIEKQQVLILDQNCPWLDTVLSKMPQILAVVYPSYNGNWMAQMVPKSKGSFVTKRQFPTNWKGKRDSELALATGITTSVFCHNGGHLAAAKTKEDAVLLAELALD